MTSLGSLNEHGGVVLQLVVRVGSLLQQNLHHVEVTSGTSEAERGVVVVGRLLVDVRPAGDQELDRTQVTRPGGLHQRGSTSLALVLQTCVVLEQEVRHVGVTVLTRVGQRGITGTWVV